MSLLRVSKTTYTRYAWGVLIYMLFVVVWGAVVRASGSGDGCGKHWPLCGGQLIPTFQRIATLIEFSHRMSTGLAGPLVLLLVVGAYRLYPRKHTVRMGVNLALLFTIVEAALGAVLVKFGLVAGNESVARAVAISLHLLNTFLLIMALTLTAWWSGGAPAFSFRKQGTLGLILGAGLALTLFLAVSGALTAMIDTLHPTTSLQQAWQQDFGGQNAGPLAWFIRLRLLHPAIAISVGIYTIAAARFVAMKRPNYETQRIAYYVTLLFCIELAAGFTNVLLLTRIGMQLLHLLIADLLWIAFVLLAASALARKGQTGEDIDR